MGVTSSASVSAPEKSSAIGAQDASEDLSASPAAVAAAFATVTPYNFPEQPQEREVQVEGKLPGWLQGSVVRNGPVGYTSEMKHSFDGFAFLIKFTFRDGKVYTMQRTLDTDAKRNFNRSGKLQTFEFGTFLPLSKMLWRAFTDAIFQRSTFTDNANVNTYVLPGGKSMVAMTEAVSGTYKVDLDTLATLERVQYSNDGIKGALTTAHPAIYPDGSIYNLFLEVGGGRSVVRIDPATQERTLVAEVPMDNPSAPSWVHDLPATENYIVVPDTPIVNDIMSLKTLSNGGSEYCLFKWAPEIQKTVFHVVPRAGGPVKSIQAPFNYMAFHYANAFESPDGRTIYLDVAVYDDPKLINLLSLGHLRNLEELIESRVSRITIPLDGGAPSIKTTVPVSDYTNAELYRINPNYKFKEHQFVYSISSKQPTKFSNAVSKLDVKNGSSKQWYQPGCITTEPLMIPRPGSTTEDDGVVTSMVTGNDGKGFLLVLDAKTFEEIARATLPYGLPYGFHNQYFPA